LQPGTVGNIERVKLRAGLLELPLDEDVVVFSEDGQSLIGLNPSAAFIFGELQDGKTPSAIAQSLVSQGTAADLANEWVSATIEALDSHGMLESGRPLPAPVTGDCELEELSRLTAGMPPYAPVESAIERRYRLLETRVLIRFAMSQQIRLVNAVIGHLATNDPHPADVTIDIHGSILEDGHLHSDVYRDGQPMGRAERLSRLGPIVKSAVWQSAVNGHDFFLYLHAGVVGTGESCILLPAAAGSGKSSLTAALTHGGFNYYSDEVALVEPGTFRVPPVALAICVKSTGGEVIARYYPEVMQVPTHIRGDGKVVRYIPPPKAALDQPSLPVSHMVFPHYAAGAPTELTPISRSDALGRIIKECLALSQRLDRRNTAELVDWISAVQCYSLDFSSLDQAVELIRQAIKK
jgi:hypothetical protein